MQYETIILELLERIKKLEDEVSTLKLQVSDIMAERENNTNNDAESLAPFSQSSYNVPSDFANSSYKKMTDEMIERCYQYGKRFYNGENPQVLANEAVSKLGMNRTSAIIYIYAVNSMLSGTVFKRAINAKSIRMYLNKISDDYGPEGLKKALRAINLHIEYRKMFGHSVDAIEEICRCFEELV